VAKDILRAFGKIDQATVDVVNQNDGENSVISLFGGIL
jgi:hypothetical protein